MDPKVQEDVTTQTSSSGSGSIVSGLSSLENDTQTDEFGREILAHAREDQRRLQQAIQGDGLRAFRKARPLSQRKSLTIENLERRKATEDDTAPPASPESPLQHPRHQRSVSESQFTNRPNVPRQWGSKGIQRNSFLRRLSSFSPTEKDKPKPADPDTIYRRRTVLTGDSPPSDIDWTSAAADLPLPTTERPSPLLRPKTHDGSSITTLRNSSLDHILRVERGEQLENNSPARTGIGVLNSPSKSEPDLGQYDDAEINRVSRELAGPRNNRGAVVAFDSSKPAHIISPYKPKTPGSRDLLKQLARAASSTPSPPARESLEKIAKGGSFQASRARQSKLERTAHTNTQRLPTPPEDTPSPIHSPPYTPKTPVVTGAWVDTPMTVKTTQEIGKLGKESKLEKSLANSLAKPTHKHPQSALEAVLREAKRSTHDEDMYNESTINSLKDLLEQDVDLSTVIPFDDETLALVQNVGVPLNQAQQERQQEILALQRMSERLRSARSGLRDASRGMKRVEDEVEEMDQLYKSSGRRGCSKCGCPGGRVTLWGLVGDAYRDIASKFVVRPKGEGKAKLTLLGWVCLIVGAWFVSEFTLLMYYNPPSYTYSLAEYILMVMDDYDYDDRPHLPFYTTTIVLRPYNWEFKYIFKVVFWICWRLYRHARYHIFRFLGKGEEEAAAFAPAAITLWRQLFGVQRGALPTPEIAIGQDDVI